ncbi:hydrolase-HD superfamily protein [Rhizoctonia solani AG-3 Rhs1AP]|uniref:5'-deoxynucleotidase n=1 Tax=Rhizoctonia solani AG-3 Rhs1AP TaxID=1086054 RepID=A0A0A1UM88_9AGAM|nr:hydrolase-HD superfamily protein [Rhizoctonia solani AG-3 Rhs1AP]
MISNSEPPTGESWKRDLPVAYTPTMDPSVDRLAFFHILERLKTQKRTGWIKSKIPGPESIADHMHRMSILALCTSDANLDVSKCVMMAVVHDLAEAVVGDIAPWEGISKAEKVQREREGMKSMLSDMLHDGPGAIRIRELWEEYEEQATPEAKFVKDLDRLEMALQAAEYERKFPDEPNKLQSFFDSSLPDIKHPEVAQWGGQLQEQRTKEQSVARSSVANGRQ